MIGCFLTGLYTFRMIFLAFWGEAKVSDIHAPVKDVPGISLGVPVAILTVLAAFAGFIQVFQLWTPISDWLDPVAPPLVEPSSAQEVVSSVCAVLLGLAGIGIAWWIYGARRAKAPEPLPLLERKFYFDELYDAIFYRPAVLLSQGLLRFVERPIVFGSLRELGQGMRGLGQATRSLQTGLVRTYAFAIIASLTVLTVVLVAVR